MLQRTIPMFEDKYRSNMYNCCQKMEGTEKTYLLSSAINDSSVRERLKIADSEDGTGGVQNENTTRSHEARNQPTFKI